MTDEIKIHISRAKQDPAIPERSDGICPDCKIEGESGFGLAGGGYGAYTYCPQCYRQDTGGRMTDPHEIAAQEWARKNMPCTCGGKLCNLPPPYPGWVNSRPCQAKLRPVIAAELARAWRERELRKATNTALIAWLKACAP